jgi:translation initiation factor 2 subunit 2
MDYEASLDRALDSARTVGGGEARLQVPDPVAQRDGAFTRLTNLAEIADALARDPEHLHRSVQKYLGTNGQFEGDWARYNGQFSAADFEEALSDYVDRYVTCSECGLPDTRLVTEDRMPMLRCDACGAFRPVSKQSRTRTRTTSPDAVEEGETYEVKIVGTGRKGDGVAERGKYTMFVPGAREGQVVTVRVENVSGTLAFTRLVEAESDE